MKHWPADWRSPPVLRTDLLAGLTGAVVVLPQAMAFATLAGLPLIHGLSAAVLPCIVAAVFGSSRYMVTGPANAISLTTMALVAPLAAVGTDDYVRLVLTLTFLVGLMQLLAGLARAGSLIEHVPHSVIVGFTAGAALLIVNSQLGPMLGLTLPRGLSVLANAQAAFEQASAVQWQAAAATACTVAVAWLWRPLNRLVPSLLVAVLAGTALAHGLQAWVGSGPALATVQALPALLPPLSWPDLSIDTVRSLFGATLVLTLLGLTEAAAIARAAARARGDALDGNREFIGQGLANLVGAFVSAMPASGSFNRTGVNLDAGARTPMAAASAGVFLVLIVLLVAPWVELLPLAVIAGLLLVVAWGLIDGPEIRRLWRTQAAERLPLLLTLLGTVTLSLEWALLLGLMSALIAKRWQPAGP